MDCYGESLIRKFDSDEPPPAWITAITSLNDYQLRQGLRRLILSGKPHPPTLPEFMKLCRTVGHADDVPDRSNVTPISQIAHDDGFDVWAVRANQRLLAYVLRCGKDRRYFDPRQTRVLVALKNRWTDLMRSAGDEEPSLPDQGAAWIECIRMAEAELARDAAA